MQNRLAKTTKLKADYTQKISNSSGKEIQQGSGKFYIKRPNLFRMDNQSPQQNYIISDGKNLWFYDPFVEQVTVNDLTKSINNTPFILLTGNDRTYWQYYAVKQQGDNFTLTPTSDKSNIKQFTIRIDKDGMLKNFSTIEKDGQVNLYILRNITNQNIQEQLFQFVVPKGVEVDDQRKK